MEHKIGIALGGGGARGSYQIGILKALDEANILNQVHHVSGTSIGAINTMMVMAKLSYERMIEIWEMINNSDIYGSSHVRLKMDKLGIFSLQDAFQVFKREISLSEIRNSKIQGYATSAKIKKDSIVRQVMINRMEKEVFHLNEFKDPHKAVLASASIPLLFGSTSIDDNHYVDGGAVDICPVQPLLDQGCDIIIVVPIDLWFRYKKFTKLPILMISLKTHYLFRRIPIDVLDFKPSVVTDNAEYGYQMGKLMIDKLRKLNILDQDGNWHKPDQFKYVYITKAEEKEMKKEG